MTNGVKFALASVAALVLATGIEVAYIKHKRAVDENAPTAAAYNQPGPSRKLTADDDVFLKKQHPDSLKDERELIGKTVWISAADQMDYYKDTGKHVDWTKRVGTLRGAEPLEVKDIFEQVAPASGRAVSRISAGSKHVLMAFTMPKSADPKQLYAMSIGHYVDGAYEFLSDEIFFYDDPHTLYKHWGPEVWAHIEKHEVAVGMTENECMLSIGQVIDPHGDTIGDRTVTYDNMGHPIDIDFKNGKAVKITPGK
ncbi:hypothetical protein ACFQBQ_10195 [Granulicella cerasi]|uniref:Uncharacterized protein n=1 Tax=Granulicella cerasi TaxID=741063 RepID=A0ABW1ZB47_9BACT|nr:hypothetical protein [Granulicella cerasi]